MRSGGFSMLTMLASIIAFGVLIGHLAHRFL